MTQRVNLQYTVDIDELPTETNRLITKAHKQSELCSCILSELCEIEDVLSMDNLQCIEKARATLMNIDYALQDIQNIIRGYVAHKSGIEQQPQTTSQEIPTASLYEPSEINLDDLEKQINNFKETFEQQTSSSDDTTKEQEL